MNIFKTFEIFLREPLSILKDRIIQIVNIQSDYAHSPSITAELLDKKAQITIINSEKMYNLFQTVLYKRQINKSYKLLELTEKNPVVFGQLIRKN